MGATTVACGVGGRRVGVRNAEPVLQMNVNHVKPDAAGFLLFTQSNLTASIAPINSEMGVGSGLAINRAFTELLTQRCRQHSAENHCSSTKVAMEIATVSQQRNKHCACYQKKQTNFTDIVLPGSQSGPQHKHGPHHIGAGHCFRSPRSDPRSRPCHGGSHHRTQAQAEAHSGPVSTSHPCSGCFQPRTLARLQKIASLFQHSLILLTNFHQCMHDCCIQNQVNVPT